jgi:hypothetical protein
MGNTSAPAATSYEMNWSRCVPFIAALASGAIGLAVSTGSATAVVISITAPALWIRQRSASFCFCCALTYYLLALWSLPVVARNFFGPKTGFLEGLGLWLIASGLLALPWRWLWSTSASATLWRVPLALLMSIIPPLGLIGWASPTVAAGLLFPATGLIGLAISICLPGCLAVAPWQTVIGTLALSMLCNTVNPQPPCAPEGWQGIDTNYGAIANERPNLLREYQIVKEVQARALASTARVIVFPESTVLRWTAATNLFWEETTAELREAGKIVIIGTIAPVAAPHSWTNYAEHFAYINAVVIRGVETGWFTQRVPVPFGMWRPFTNTGAPLRLGGPAVIQIADHTAAIIVCYEQLIPWPVLTSFLERPSILIAVANNSWVFGTPIPRVQQSSMQAWARLFHVPVIFAVNS